MRRILVIEDDEELRWLLGRMLVSAGYEVQEATDGKAGLASYRQARCDVVLTDILMPQSDGLQTIRALCLEDSEVKIIAMSGGGRGSSSDYLNVAQKFGAQKILLKPFSRDELLAAIEDVLGREDGPSSTSNTDTPTGS